MKRVREKIISRTLYENTCEKKVKITGERRKLYNAL